MKSSMIYRGKRMPHYKRLKKVWGENATTWEFNRKDNLNLKS